MLGYWSILMKGFGLKDFHLDISIVDIFTSISPYVPHTFIALGMIFVVAGLDDLLIDLLAFLQEKAQAN